MHKHACRQSGDDLLELHQHIAEGTDHVTAVDEQDVAIFKFIKNVELLILYPLADNFRPELFQPRHLVGLDTDMATRVSRIL